MKPIGNWNKTISSEYIVYNISYWIINSCYCYENGLGLKANKHSKYIRAQHTNLFVGDMETAYIFSNFSEWLNWTHCMVHFMIFDPV